MVKRGEAAEKIGEAILELYFGKGKPSDALPDRVVAPFGTRTKVELEGAIYDGLVAGGVQNLDVDAGASQFLLTTPAAAKKLKMAHQLRTQ